MLESVWSLIIQNLSVQSVLVGIVVGIIAYQLLKKRYKLPPGPRPLPLIGNMLSFKGTTLYEKSYEWAKIYGPVMKVYFGPKMLVVLSDADVVLEALVKKSYDFAGRNSPYSMDVLTEGRKDISLADYGPIWKCHRTMITKALRHYMTGKQLEEKVHSALDKGVEAMMAEKRAFDPFPIFANTIINMLWAVCFGVNHDLDHPEFQDIVRVLDEFRAAFGNGFLEDFIPPLRLCPTKRFRKVMDLSREWMKKIDAKIQEHKTTFSADHIRDLTDTLLVAQQEETENPELMDDVYLRQGIGDIMSGGVDTSRITMSWTFLFMALNPEIQNRVHKEIDALPDISKYPKISDKESLCYTEATLHESMRLGTAIPLGLPHKTLKDTSVGGYEVPCNTTVVINHWALHHDPDRWEQPDRFLPERFLDEDGKMAPKPESWLPFSAGRRNCLGETVARPELLLLFAGFMKKFQVSLGPGENPDIKDVTGGGFVCIPPKYKITVTERD